MPRSSITLALSDAKRMLEAGEAKAASIGIAYNIAVVDAGGALVAFTRQDGALIGSIDLAISKAITARLFDKRTSDLARMAQPGAPLFGRMSSRLYPCYSLLPEQIRLRFGTPSQESP